MAVVATPRPVAGPAPAERGRRAADSLVVIAFVASGAAGLMYQVVWSRQLVLVFGNTTEAIGTIVTAFMAGLGLGGLAGGFLGPRLRHPLRVYAAIEIAVGCAALLVPVGFHLIEGAYRSVYDTTSAGQLTLVRLLLTMAVVTPVTFLMGLTLPLLTRHLVTTMHTAGKRMGRLYSANTFGAMAGTLVSGFILIEIIGLSATTHVAIALNLLAGLVALAVSTRTGVANREQPDIDGVAVARAPLTTRMRRLVYAATFVSGFVALALEVLWTRMLAEGTGSRIYNFVIILAVYLAGIAAGGFAYRILSSPRRDTVRVLSLAFLIIAASTLLTVPLTTLWLSTLNMARAFMLLPATLCMGYAFPLSARMLARDPAHSARSIGTLYAWNTVGSILGSLAAAFVLAGTLGTNSSVLVLSAAEAGVALLLVVAGPGVRRAPSMRLSLAAGAFVLAPVILVATGSPVLLTATDHRLAATGLPFRHTEDRLSTVDALGGPPARRRLFVSGTAMTSLSVDTKLMAYIPKVIRPNAQNFLDICFGMGTTFRSALILGMHTDAVDLSPSVPWQMPTFYPDAEQYLHSPLARVITADGRNYLHLTSRTYDVISVDPPPPINSAGAVVLYTQEFYADAKARLRPGGLMLEWLLFGGVRLDELREHLHTFRSEFSYVLILMSPVGDGVYMIGSDSPISWNTATVNRIMGSPSATEDISDAPDYARVIGDTPWPEMLQSMEWMNGADVDTFAGSAPLITDDRPLSEYFFLHDLFGISNDPLIYSIQLRRLWPGLGGPAVQISSSG